MGAARGSYLAHKQSRAEEFAGSLGNMYARRYSSARRRPPVAGGHYGNARPGTSGVAYYNT
jgi:hypothetical protein